MVGTIINVAGILAGAMAGLFRKKGISAANEAFLKLAIGAFTIFYGLRLTWLSINGSFLQVLRQVLIMIVALMLGKICGRLMRLQKTSNRLGASARASIEAVAKGPKPGPGEGFKVCAVLFCAAPLGILGALQDGLSDYFYPLIVKGGYRRPRGHGFRHDVWLGHGPVGHLSARIPRDHLPSCEPVPAPISGGPQPYRPC